MKKLIVEEGAHAQTLLQFLASELGVSKRRAKALLDERVVFVNGKRIWIAQHELHSGDWVELPDSTMSERRIDSLAVLFENDRYLICDKPSGIISNAQDGSAEEILRTQFSSPRIVAVHRLDRDTSGCMLFAKTGALKEELEALFRKRRITKIYHALVLGRLPSEIKEVTTPLDDLPARTLVAIIAANAKATYLKVEIETGRMHQIRKHLASIGFPVLGDKEYERSKIASPLVRNLPRQMLHARKIAFTAPKTTELIEAQAPLPDDFRQAMATVGFPSS